tara:strand:+ start:888 stop:1118 length:231 start_codon:yes stop_codon:yes gene_type:complete
MEHIDQKLKKINNISEEHKKELEFIIEKLKAVIKADDITLGSTKSLTKAITELSQLRDKHVEYLITWLKQGFFLDE